MTYEYQFSLKWKKDCFWAAGSCRETRVCGYLLVN